MRKLALSGVTTAAVLVGSVLVALPAHATTTYVVAADGMDCTDSTHTATTANLTIASAVSDASSGDIIVVCAGTYLENVTTDKSLTFRGNMASVAATSPRSGPETIWNGNGHEALVASGGSTTIDGFTFTGTGSSTAYGSLDLSGDDDEVENIIFDHDSEGVTASGNALTVERNDFVGATDTATTVAAVNVTDNGQGDVIQNNTVAGWIFDAAFEMDAPVGTTGVKIQNNTVDVSAGGRFARIGGTSGLDLSDNTVKGGSNSTDGLLMGGGNSGYQIYANTFDGFSNARAINFTGSFGFTANDGGYIMQNGFHNNLEAVEVADNDLTTALHIVENTFVDNGAGVSPTATNNPGVAIWDPEGSTVDASNNYWGCDTGADTTGCDYYAEGTPGAVTVTPYLHLTGTLGASSIPQGGTTSLTATLRSNSAGGSAPSPLIDPLLQLHYAFDKGSVAPTDDSFINDGQGTVTGSTSGDGTVTVTVAHSSISFPLTVEPVTPPPPVVPTVTIHDASTAEGNSGTHGLTFAVSLSKKSSKAVTVHFTTANGTAVAGHDYIAKHGLLTIGKGKTVGYVTIQIKGDKVKEATECFYVVLSKPTNAKFGSARGTGYIWNDDK